MKKSAFAQHGLQRFVAVFCALFLSTFCFPFFAEAEPSSSVRVGAVLSLSGGLEQWCGYIQKGMELARDEQGEIPISILFEDDRSADRKTAVTAAQKLISIDKADILYTWTTATAPAIAPIATAAKVPLIVGAYDDKIKSGGPFVFGAFVNYEKVPREIAHFLVASKHAKRLALVLGADDWSQSVEAPFREEAERLGASIVLNETLVADETHLEPVVERLKQRHVDAVVAPLFGNSLYSFLKEARNLRYPGMIHVADGMFEEDLHVAGASAEGIFATQIWTNTPSFSKKYAAKFGATINPLQAGLAATGYDLIKHIQGAAKEIAGEGKEVSGRTLAEKLSQFKSQGVTGEQLYGKPPSRSGEIEMVVRNQRYVPVD